MLSNSSEPEVGEFGGPKLICLTMRLWPPGAKLEMQIPLQPIRRGEDGSRMEQLGETSDRGGLCAPA